ncbi:hypothetical protein BpHYR1_000507 [Brachionus plicatilis]|uniref:Uncharacterized protein n=1 Tax=Brachionus plicatilis TaxID=10195 RepID=A0A3M7R2E2_BRAPC|nr:hypothetical protein BpHYR1_000507 [Brachionus plicatilis]
MCLTLVILKSDLKNSKFFEEFPWMINVITGSSFCRAWNSAAQNLYNILALINKDLGVSRGSDKLFQKKDIAKAS